MIYVKRFPEPDGLRLRPSHMEQMKLGYKKINIKHLHPLRSLQLMKESLIEQFSGKCAFCETYLGDNGNIHHFYPKSKNNDEKYKWKNLYYACHLCERNKGSRFPMKRENGELVASLIDPCLENPEEHLLFLQNGEVVSHTDRGLITIETFGLNRLELIHRRMSASQSLQEKLMKLKEDSQRQNSDWMQTFNELRDYSEFTAMKRRIIREFLSENRLMAYAIQREAGPLLEKTPIFNQDQYEKATKLFEEHQAVTEDYDLAQKESIDNYYQMYRIIEKVEIHNFRCIEHLEFTLQGEGKRAPWLMLLGENGVGKSSILQAITLTLLDQTYRNELLKDKPAAYFLREGAEEGYVRVYFTGKSKPSEIRFNRNSAAFLGKELKQKVLVLGYGSIRILKHSEQGDYANGEYARVDNLFDPFYPLVSTEPFIAKLPGKRFRDFRKVLRSLLNMKRGEVIKRDTDNSRVYIDYEATSIRLNDHSDGYQSIIALAADIMRVMYSLWDDAKEAEGIVMLDELDAHLHPRWKIQIVSKLRSVFPRIQFIVTTHDPLCLRGLERGEIVVLNKDHSHRVSILHDETPQEGLEVDELLTSTLFGLSSTISPEIQRMFERYYYLLSFTERAQAQEDEISRLQQKLKQYKLLGTTRREQLMYKAIDKFLAQSQSDIIDESTAIERLVSIFDTGESNNDLR